jgi:hypothetical protein
MLSISKATLGAVTVVLLSTSMASAQRSDRGSDDPRPSAKQSAPVQTAKLNNNGSLTIDEVAAMLKDLGYQSKLNKLDNGSVVLYLDISTNGRTCMLDVELSKDGTKVWLTAWFRKLSEGQTIPSNIMMQLLESGCRFGPCHFAISSGKQLYLGCPLDNRSLTSEDLRRQIDIFLSVFNQTEYLWNSNKWAQQ